MGSIRKQSIVSSILIYIGFLFGALNTYLFTKQGFFTPEQYGLTQAFIAINLVFFSLANLGSPALMSRLHPYYHEKLKDNENDLLSLVLKISFVGFILLCIGTIVFKPFFIRKFSGHSLLLVDYFYWTLPYTFFFLIYFMFETQSSINKKTILPNFLKETGLRLWITILILLFSASLISFPVFVELFSISYLILAIILGIYLHKIGKLHFTFRSSIVTKEKSTEIRKLLMYVYAGNVIFYVAQNIDVLTISSQHGLESTAVFALSNYIASIITVPQRGLIPISMPHLASAWKNNDIKEIHRIYSRSSINLLILALFIFLNIWLNIDDLYNFLSLSPLFQTGKYVILIIGIKYIIDLGTGINSQILYASPNWRFEFTSGIVLLFLSVPLNYFLVKQYDIIGAAIAGFIALTIYNTVRLIFIYKKFKLQPFSINSLYAIGAALLAFGITYFAFFWFHGFIAIIVRCFIFSVIFFLLVYYFKLTPDLKPVLESIKKRITRK